MAGGISIAIHDPHTKISGRSGIEAIVFFGLLFGFISYRTPVRDQRLFPQKEWQAPFWTSSFDEAPVNWVKTGILWACCAAPSIFVVTATGQGLPTFGFMALGFAVGLAAGLLAFKKRMANPRHRPNVFLLSPVAAGVLLRAPAPAAAAQVAGASSHRMRR